MVSRKFALCAALVATACALVMAVQEALPVYSSREEIPASHKWDLDLFYPGWGEWEADVERMESLYMGLAAYRGRLAEGPEVLLEMLRLSDQAGEIGSRVWGFVSMSRDIDMRDNGARARHGQLMGVYARTGPALSWISPEILTIPRETMLEWLDRVPGLAPYRFGLMDTYRTGEYTLDAEGERLLNLHGNVRRTAREVHGALTNADVEQPEIILADGRPFTVTAGSYRMALNTMRDPRDRRAVQEAWTRQFAARRNTFAAIYSGILAQGWATGEARGYPSTLAMRLDRNNIPEAVVTSLIAAARDGAHALQRYHHLRQSLMELDSYGWSDMHVPLVEYDAVFPYDDIVPLVIDSVAPLGEEYHAGMAGQFQAGYVDVHETPGKRSGAYNTSRYGVGSFVLLNYKGTLDDVFTVAHEMGHSMHSRLSQQYQPFATHGYTIFVAEVASVLNEKLLLRRFLQTEQDPVARIALLESRIAKIAGTFFLQTMMADFELQAHQLFEQGEGLTADRFTGLWSSIVAAYFRDLVAPDDPYLLSWARIPHLYNSPFYVYQYATCYASAASLLQQMDEDPAAVERYLELLKSGGNDYPMNQLRKAGVDLADPGVLTAVTREFSRLVDLLEGEYARFQDGHEGSFPSRSGP
jgi:oligoendopeptidase F